MIGRADYNSPEYQALIGPNDPPTAGEIWLSKCWCQDCCSLLEAPDGRWLVINRCSKCNSNNLVRPPAYGPLQLDLWCQRRSKNRTRVREQMTTPLVWPRPPRSPRDLILPCGMNKSERERPRRSIDHLIDWEEIKRTFPKKQREELSVTEMVAEARERAAFDKRKGIDRDPELTEILHGARRDEGPNAERKITAVKPFNL